MSTNPGDRFPNIEPEPPFGGHPLRAPLSFLAAGGYLLAVLAGGFPVALLAGLFVPLSMGVEAALEARDGRGADARGGPMREARRTGIGLVAGGLLTLLAVLAVSAVGP